MSDPTLNPSFGAYEVIEKISSGGMAEIFKARKEGLGGFERMFALKRVSPHYAHNPDYIDMLVEEAKIAGLLNLANIVQIVDLGQTGEQPFIAMEYVNGPNLEQVLERVRSRNKLLPIPHAAFICIELLKALEYAHNRQVMRGGRPVPLDIVHRDVCPSNVLLSTRGEVKLADFGIAKASVRQLKTVTGIVKGRFDYLSPEQTRGEEATQRSDLFSVGIMLYEMVTGRHPFKMASEGQTIEAIKKASFTPAVAFNPEVPPAIDRLLKQTLTAEPGDRFASATAVKDNLDRFFHEAGYIFSSATLAAYLKGMFPELTDLPKDDNTEADEDQVTRPFVRGQRPIASEPAVVETEEVPTSDGEEFLSNLSLDPTGDHHKPLTSLDTSLSGFFGPVDDENTIVGQKSGDNPEWNELDTVIRPVMETPSEAPTRAAAARIRVSGAETQVSGRPYQASKARPKPSQQKRRMSSNAAMRRAQLLSLAIGIVIVVAALLVGFLLGNRAARLTQAPSSNVTISSDPRLEVHTPDGATLSIDGREVSGTSPHVVTLTPDKSHIVRISRVGYFPVETVVKLRKNDVRVLTVEGATQFKKER